MSIPSHGPGRTKVLFTLYCTHNFLNFIKYPKGLLKGKQYYYSDKNPFFLVIDARSLKMLIFLKLYHQIVQHLDTSNRQWNIKGLKNVMSGCGKLLQMNIRAGTLLNRRGSPEGGHAWMLWRVLIDASFTSHNSNYYYVWNIYIYALNTHQCMKYIMCAYVCASVCVYKTIGFQHLILIAHLSDRSDELQVTREKRIEYKQRHV